MKSKRVMQKLAGFFLFIILFSSCSEFLLVPITVNYPFDENSTSSPSKYEINIEDGLNLLDGVLTKQTKEITNGVVEKSLKKQFPDADSFDLTVIYPEFETDDIIKIISGETITKKIAYNAKIKIDGAPEVNKSDEENFNFSICDFEIKPEISDEGIRMTMKNITDFCKLSDENKKEKIDYCKEPSRTIDELKSCVYVEARHENTSISIMLAEVNELKDYKKYLDKIYSATLNDITFTIIEKPNVPLENKSFILEAELFCQSIDSFKKDGTKCESSVEEGCEIKGVNEKGELENYFSDDKEIREKYLVGVFGTSTFEDGEKLELLYTYEGKDILQKAIKHLDFQIGAKSYYLFFPQAKRPKGKLTADIKAKLLFNVEPLN